MPTAPPLPRAGSVFLDTRGDDRVFRVAWHPEADLVVLSLWRDDTCMGTFRLSLDEVPDLIEALQSGPVRRGGSRVLPTAPRAS